ncbi:UNVERIFIED_ORG: hypothetical protein M2435_001956 [Rhizobium sophorae]|uniref:hypothetical protein n=1 Tax=Rhizobium leguminosarum TaxID=384 RepID=UPI001620A0D4|nr:hypothetical protein [Rhizobium leguminosarum]MBB4521926.1 hypothetical protein [Rhizobium leguminosarum]MDH6659053.1 hypothetical protein [Rhizobium sophorae]
MQDIIIHVLTFLAGLGAGFVLKVRLDASKRSKVTNIGDGSGRNNINQNRNKVGGHMAGRDVNVNDR